MTAPPTSQPPSASANAASRGGAKATLVALLVPVLLFALVEGVCRVVEPANEMVELAGVEGAKVPAWVATDPAIARGFDHLDMVPAGLDKAAIFRFWEFYRRDRDLHYRLRPGLHASTVNTFVPRQYAEGARWHITSNAEGFRGRLLPGAPLPGQRLVVCLGDSSTYGWGVEENVTYPVRLEEHLRQSGGPGWTVVNLGHPGYTSWQGRLLMERLARLRPAVVTIAYGPNDSAVGGVSDREMWERDHSLVGRAAAAADHLAAYRALRRAVLAIWAPAARAGGEGKLVDRVPLREYYDNLRAIVAAARRAGATPILVGIANKDPYLGVMQRVAGETGTAFRQAEALYQVALEDIRGGRAYAGEVRTLQGRLGALLDKDPVYYCQADHTHPNAIGHDLIARNLSALILSSP